MFMLGMMLDIWAFEISASLLPKTCRVLVKGDMDATMLNAEALGEGLVLGSVLVLCGVIP